ncbi:M48 family metalloprotease [Aminobacter sp. UC22_36]|uniref:M48 family metalloprotease n=1 Tax=Aminobacter sp. UC22_36 TaxID=3374549 RepID=UPI0037567FB4
MQSITSLSRFVARSTRAVTALAMSAGLALGSTGAAHAQNVPIVRDAEIEALVRDYARPILKAAGLANSNINIVLVNDPAFNAFVAGRRMFINTGALMTAETPNEIIGVIAHEAGHIAGGHQERLRDQLARAQTMAIVAALLGAGAMVAGAATDTSGLGAAGAGVVAGGSEMARRSLLGYQRSEETTADRSAMTYLNATGQSAQGMLKTFQRFQTALSLSGARVDPYQVSHPMPRERIANLETLARESPFFDKKDSEALQQRHDMMRVKIAAYTQGQAAASRLLRSTDGLASRYGDAQSTYLFGDLRSALTKTDALIKSQPKNAYFHELRGDILMKSNKPAAAAEAYAAAVRLDTAKSGILPIALGQTYLAMGTPDALKKAVVEIRKGLDRDRENASGYRYLAQAYGMLGDVADADLATADGHYYSGAYQDAKIFAMRAQMKLQRGSPGWVRAQDIINYKAPSKKKK